MTVAVSAVKAELRAVGWRESSGLLISPEQQVRDGLSDGWRFGDIKHFMLKTGIAAEVVTAAIEAVRASRWKPDPAARLVAAWLTVSRLPPPFPKPKRDDVDDFDRATVARMFVELGYPHRVERTMAGGWDYLPLLSSLAIYRRRFEAGEELTVQDARIAAASHLDDVSRWTSGEPDDICAPSLRLGLDTTSPVGRAFVYHHRRLCRL